MNLSTFDLIDCFSDIHGKCTSTYELVICEDEEKCKLQPMVHMFASVCFMTLACGLFGSSIAAVIKIAKFMGFLQQPDDHLDEIHSLFYNGDYETNSVDVETKEPKGAVTPKVQHFQSQLPPRIPNLTILADWWKKNKEEYLYGLYVVLRKNPSPQLIRGLVQLVRNHWPKLDNEVYSDGLENLFIQTATVSPTRTTTAQTGVSKLETNNSSFQSKFDATMFESERPNSSVKEIVAYFEGHLGSMVKGNGDQFNELKEVGNFNSGLNKIKKSLTVEGQRDEGKRKIYFCDKSNNKDYNDDEESEDSPEVLRFSSVYRPTYEYHGESSEEEDWSGSDELGRCHCHHYCDEEEYEIEEDEVLSESLDLEVEENYFDEEENDDCYCSSEEEMEEEEELEEEEEELEEEQEELEEEEEELEEEEEELEEEEEELEEEEEELEEEEEELEEDEKENEKYESSDEVSTELDDDGFCEANFCQILGKLKIVVTNFDVIIRYHVSTQKAYKYYKIPRIKFIES